MTQITFRTTLNFGCLGEREVEITGQYSPGRPQVNYLRNGDPGYPEEPAEFEGDSIMLLMPPELRQHWPELPEKLELPASFVALMDDATFEQLNEQGCEEGAAEREEAQFSVFDDDKLGAED
jgi:hypothetical protein